MNAKAIVHARQRRTDRSTRPISDVRNV